MNSVHKSRSYKKVNIDPDDALECIKVHLDDEMIKDLRSIIRSWSREQQIKKGAGKLKKRCIIKRDDTSLTLDLN